MSYQKPAVMVAGKTFVRTGLISLCLCAALSLFARDGVCLNMNRAIEINSDSVTNDHGGKDAKPGLRNKKKVDGNNPQLNSWSLDVFGFFYSTVAQSYERRIKDK